MTSGVSAGLLHYGAPRVFAIWLRYFLLELRGRLRSASYTI
jgi:hypothetical protein